MEKFDQWLFQKMRISQFNFMSIGLSFIGDVIYVVFLKFVLGDPENLKAWMQKNAEIPNMQLILENPDLMNQMQENFHLFLNILIGLLVLSNLWGYIYFLRGKKFAIKYTKNLALMGVVFGVLAVGEAKDHGFLWLSIMIVLIPMYFYVYRGIQYFYKAQS